MGVGVEAKLQEWFHLPQDMASPRWGETEFLNSLDLTEEGNVIDDFYFTLGTIQTVVMTAAQRTPRTPLLHSVSSQWAWARFYYLSHLTLLLALSLPPCHLASDCVWTLRRGGSLSTTHTLCECCGRGLSIAPPLFAQRSVSLAEGLCSYRS